ncbi:MAG: DUF362 domain-containing protein [Elusimicrobiota bacterium]|nr:DUF362 domain-containing protein [Elusimicrobiota bacterium]
MPEKNPARVYFTSYITPESINKLLDCIDLKSIILPNDFSAIKMHFGEKGNEGFIKPEFVEVIVERIKSLAAVPFLTDANTIYVGERADAINHLKIAEQHGFSYDKVGCPVIIADGLRGNSYVEVEIANVAVKPKHFSKVKIANGIYYADSVVFVTHFKGHELTGFGGALKNAGMGCASRSGKYELHNSVVPKLKLENCNGCGICIKWCPGNALSLIDRGKLQKSELNRVEVSEQCRQQVISLNTANCTGCGECILVCKQKVFRIPWDEPVKNVQEKTVEYCLGVLRNKRVVFLNFLNFITKYCDCYETKEKPLVDDIGIVLSTDPVAIDQASVDLVNKKFRQQKLARDGVQSDFFRYIWPEIDYEIQLKYAQQLGLGNRNYHLTEINERSYISCS